VTVHSYFVTAARGLVDQVEAELQELGARATRREPAGVRVRGPLHFGYRVCLWSRCASRVVMHLQDLAIDGPDDLYRAARDFPWEEHLDPEGTLAVDVSASGEVITHSHFASLRIKDGVVDRMRDRFSTRPSVDVETPDVRIVAYVRGRGCSLGIDLSGGSLHRRGWRADQGAAPLKETIAAAMLRRGGWPARAAAGEPLLDPVCGAGTLLIEGATMAIDRAPAIERSHFGFLGWRGHDPEAWNALLAEARNRATEGASRKQPEIVGYDADPVAVERARSNARRAGVDRWVRVERSAIADVSPPRGTGLIVANPPYGERMGTPVEVARTLGELSTLLHVCAPGWRAEVIVGEQAPHEKLGLGRDPGESIAVDNGPIACLLLGGTTGDGSVPASSHAPKIDASPFAARLRKNLARLAPWARRFGVSCYRVYDDEIPSFRATIDRYGEHVHVQEYRAPSSVDPELAQARLDAMIDAVTRELAVPRERIHVKQRRPQTKGAQYGRMDERAEEIAVTEGGATFLVNFTDYLDVGLFLDHRALRRMVGELVSQRPRARVLNLFAYTGSFSVVAARAGAHTTTVDLSQTYLAWAERNFAANALDVRRHRFVRADCTRWLDEADGTWDLVVLDPPSYSASKAMVSTFEVQRDHAALVRAATAVLAPGGTLLFSTNRRGFELDPTLEDFRDITTSTLDPDVRKSPPPHRCWRFDRPAS
jgi:23S rRNA (guanine2445-N2)-methyltransferase / 23S rRNA (guanine2069-N7)-methyltransferase